MFSSKMNDGKCNNVTKCITFSVELKQCFKTNCYKSVIKKLSRKVTANKIHCQLVSVIFFKQIGKYTLERISLSKQLNERIVPKKYRSNSEYVFFSLL